MAKRGRPRLELSEEQKRELLGLEELRRSQEQALQLTRERWAAFVQDAGLAASGRAIGLSTQATFERVKTWKRKPRGSKKSA